MVIFIERKNIDRVILAGAFRTYLDVQSGIDIGMFPRIDRGRYLQVGNAAGTGARTALLSLDARKRAKEVAGQIEYVELSVEKDFPALFSQSLLFE